MAPPNDGGKPVTISRSVPRVLRLLEVKEFPLPVSSAILVGDQGTVWVVAAGRWQLTASTVRVTSTIIKHHKDPKHHAPMMIVKWYDSVIHDYPTFRSHQWPKSHYFHKLWDIMPINHHKPSSFHANKPSSVTKNHCDKLLVMPPS